MILKEIQSPEFVVSFYERLIEEHGEFVLNNTRNDLLGSEATDAEWLEYCFSSESPF